jgi:hypothetical protein
MLVHGLLAIALAAAVAQELVLVVRSLQGRAERRRDRQWSALTAWLYAATMAVGALAHPTYRYFVRALYLDHHLTWASNLFDLKELFATIGLPLAIGSALLSRALSGSDDDDRALRSGHLVAVALTAGIVWFDVGSGLWLSLQRSL